ncbi:MAG: short-chain dehydrogenase [Alphaproteobacteria bacterium HGW-Alphaproteobacteria-5]|nr:MAG: short-chain dehydrogenase [Alphaproteobacteria bacterium HGW-Alphaproteobacteria-5]
MTISSTGHSRQNKIPVFLSLGFRPFFMLAALWALFAITLWTGMFLGHVNLPAALSPLDWHVHELLYGYLPAVIAGFLLTAVPNWTGRPPRKGMLLLSLVLVWIAGRAALLYALAMPQGFAAAIDLLFLPFLMAILGSEIVAAKNWRNLPIIGVLGIFFLGNAIFHVEAILNGTASYGYGTRLGIAAAVLLVSLVGGRIVPNFTRNWLVKRPPGPMPTAFNSLDLSAMGISIIALAAWTAFPERQETGWLCLLAGILQMARLARWCGYRTLREPLVTILHIGYLFVAVGFLTVGTAILAPEIILPTAALHAWTVGAIGTMTLAVMVRASLGHTGQPLQATMPITLIFSTIVLAAVLRLNAGTILDTQWILMLASGFWILSFGLFVARIGPSLLVARK